MPEKYSIKDLELVSGIKAHTLRIWEQRYNILSPRRTDTNIRYYSSDDLRKVLNISVLNKNGHKISVIAGLSDDRLIREAGKYLEDYVGSNSKVESLYLALLSLDERRLEGILNATIGNIGFERSVEQIMFPFLKHLGNMWQTGMISPAQEHYSSNLIRQKLIVEIDRDVPRENAAPKSFLFFLPEDELHELSLLYVHYLARKAGHRSVYLGQSVPANDLLNIAKELRPDAIVSIFTTEREEEEINSLLKNCEEQLECRRFLLSGRLLLEPGKIIEMPSPRFQVFRNFDDFKKEL